MKWFGGVAKVVRLMEIRAGAHYPGYGLAYIRRSSLMCVLYPIPFNHLMRLLVKIWDSIAFALYSTTMQEELIGKSFELGILEAMRRIDEKKNEEVKKIVEFLDNQKITNYQHGGDTAIPKETLQ